MDADLDDLEGIDDVQLPALLRPVTVRVGGHPVFAMKPIALPHTPEWWEARKTGIGASEAAAACGVSRWANSNPVNLWLRKTGQLTSEVRSVEAQRGNTIERAIAQMMVDELGLTFHQFSPGMFRHPTESYCLATPDGILSDGRGAEIKATSLRDELGESGTDEVPIDWLYQAQQQMAVCGFESVVFAAFVDIADVRFFEVHRSEKLIARILDRENEIWSMVEGKIDPPIEWLDARSYDSLRQAYQDIRDGACCAITKGSAEKWYQAEKFTAEARQLLARAKALKAPAVLEMKENEWGALPCGSRLRRIDMGRSVQIRKVRGYVQR